MMRSDSNTSHQPDEAIPPGIAGQVTDFAGFLKARGYKVFQNSILDALRGLREINVSNKIDFFNVLRGNFASTDLEWSQFPELFKVFFGPEEE